MKKNGFIATSLIYSFLIVFTALIVGIVCTYEHYRVILKSLNSNILSSLNENINNKYVLLNNLVKNSSFENSNATEKWVLTNTELFDEIEIDSTLDEFGNPTENYGKPILNKDGTFKKYRNATTGINSIIFKKNADTLLLKQNNIKCSGDDRKHYFYIKFREFRNNNITADSSNVNFNVITSNSTVTYPSSNYGVNLLGGYLNWGTISYIVEADIKENSNCSLEFRVNNKSDGDYFYLVFDDIMLIDITGILDRTNLGAEEIKKYLDGEKGKKYQLEYFDNTFSYEIPNIN